MKENFWFKLDRPILALAPMAGITDSAFREMCRRYGADVVYSEMASVSALFFKPQKTLDLIRFNVSERPYIVQLFGKHPEHFAKAARIITEFPKGRDAKSCVSTTKRPDGIDINFGCPAKKVFGHGSGCAIMPQKELAREIISAVCANSDLPVSIKIRAGVQGRDAINRVSTNAMQFIENTHDLPYSAVMIHARTYEGGFSGELDFGLVEKIKERFAEKVILANGGIYTPEDGAMILKDHPKIDGLGIARGAWGRPFIFNEIKSRLFSSGRDAKSCVSTKDEYGFEKIKKIMLEHADLIYKDKGKLGLFEIRKHLAWYVKGWPGAQELRRRLVTANSLEEIKAILDSLTLTS